jgi:hypothetical protein
MRDTIVNLGMLGILLTLLFGFVSCVDTVSSEINPREDRISEISASVEAQKWICDDIEEPVYYRGRKIYNGAHTRYFKYQSVKTGKMYKPKRQPVCQELGERPFTPQALAEIKKLEEEVRVEKDALRNQNIMVLIIFWLLVITILSSEWIEEKLS